VEYLQFAVVADDGGPRDAFQRAAQFEAFADFDQWMFALARHHHVERSGGEHQLRRERRFHAAGEDDGVGTGHARRVRQSQVELQRHAGGGDADDVPRSALEYPAEIGRDGFGVQIGVEHFHMDAARAQESLQTPHAERRCEKRKFAAVGVVGPDEQQTRRGHRLAVDQSTSLRLDIHAVLPFGW